MFYKVTLLDSDGCEMASHEHDTLKAAKVAARDAIAEKEYVEAGARKVEIRDENGECVWDRFVQSQAEKERIARPVAVLK